MANLNLKLVISGSNDGAIAALNQVINRAQASGQALTQADNAGTFGKARAGVESISAQLSRLQTVAIGATGWAFFSSMTLAAVKAADEMKGIEARVRLASSSLAEFNQNLAAIRRTAQASGTDMASVAQLFNRIATPIKDMGGSADDAQAAVAMVGNALRISGASAAESSSAMLQFAQAMGSGVLRGEELGAILENAPRLAQALAAGLGVSVGQLKTLGEQGALTSQQVFKALRSQQSVLAEEAARLPQTVGMAWTNVVEGVKQYASQVDKATGATGALAALLKGVAENIPAIVSGLELVAIGVAAAFGARQVAALSAYVAKEREKIATGQLAAADNLKRAGTELAVAQAIQRKAIAELAATKVTQGYMLATAAAATADQTRAAAASMAAANQGAVIASLAVAEARAAATAASTGLLARALGAAALAGRGLLGLFGGPLGLAITAISVGAAAWEMFGNKAKAATAEAGKSVAELLNDFKQFSGKMGPAELEEALSGLRGKAAELRDQLMSLRVGPGAEKAKADLAKLEAAIEETTKKAILNNERVQEKGLLGLDKLKLGVGGLVDADTLKAMQAFDTLYRDFVHEAKKDNGQLKVSALEVNAALEKLFSLAKTPAELTELIGQVSYALAMKPNSAGLKSDLENAIEARMQAEMKALNGLVAGLEARAQRTQSLFASAANIALGQFNQAAALAKVAAELKNDTATPARLDTNSRNAEIVVAQQSANLQIAALEQVARRKRDLINEAAAATRGQAEADIKQANDAVAEHIKAFEKQVEAGKRTAAQLKDYRANLETTLAEQTAGPRAARAQAEQDAIRKTREVDAETARQRVAIADGLYKTLQGKSQEALAQYKQYAQQVIALDKKIASNRLDTASAINSLQRSDMSPKDQLKSLREELASVKAETDKAVKGGDPDYALELLNRQKSLAQQIGQQSGEGVDKKEQIKEGSAELARIGAEADAILQKQRATAQAVAAEQLATYQQMTQAMNTLAQQIATLNKEAAIQLKPEIDSAALNAAIAAVKKAFAGVTVPIKIEAGGLPGGAQAPVIEQVKTSRAYGGPLPGNAPHDRADNMMFWGTPGEWVIQRPAVRHYGSAFIAAVNAMQLPKFAFGGQLGGQFGNSSAINRLRIPSLPAGRGESPRVGATFDLGNLGRVPVQMAAQDHDNLARRMALEALKFGGRR